MTATTLTIAAAEVRRGDILDGWPGYVIERYESHPYRATGRIHLRDTRPTTAPRCWTPADPGDEVTVTREVPA